jgi:type I restriction enzyme S subunit
VNSAPTCWPAIPLARLFDACGGATPDKSNNEFWDGTIPWVSPKDMKRSVIAASEDHVTEKALAETRLPLIPAGRVLVVVRGMILAHSLPVASTSVDVTINQDMKALCPRPGVSAGFLAWLLRGLAQELLVTVEEAGHGTCCLRMELWKTIRVGLPPIAIQHAVAAFLDRKTAEIDAVVAAKERMIGLLQEQRHALISRAVTLGLDPAVPMRDSAVEWLGPVPAHWTVERLKFRFRKIEQGWSPQCENRQAEPGEWGVLKVGCMNSGVYDESENKALPTALEPVPEYEVNPGEVLMSRSNTVELVGMVGIVHQTQGRILLCDKLYRIDFRPDLLSPDYAVHLLRSKVARLQIERDASGASPSMKNISTETVGNMLLPFPPVEEQHGILAHIRQETSRIDGIMKTITEQVARLREYRQTLISAAVTGKIVVPPVESADFPAIVLAAEVVHRLHGTKHFGRTKLHKLVYAAHHHCRLTAIDADYARLAFGPYDEPLQMRIEAELGERLWYKPSPGERVTYAPLERAGEHRPHFDRMYGDRASAVHDLIERFRDLNKNQTERAMTLYAAWNDFLIRGEPVDDRKLLAEVQHNWHPEKQHAEESWRASLDWLKAQHLTPHGFGKPTRPTDAGEVAP